MKVTPTKDETTTTGNFAYSLNGQDYQGRFATREQARQAAFALAEQAVEPPQSIYVGRRQPADPMCDSHARSVIGNMQARAREQYGDQASAYLAKLPKAVIEDLDQALQVAVAKWLETHGLMPTFDKIDAVGEFPLPSVTQSKAPKSETREVQEIGTGDSYDGL